MGPTNPASATGVAPGAAASLTSTPTVYFGYFVSVPATPLYAGVTPGFAGLYQVNVTIPDGVPTGNVDIRLQFPDGTVSNPVQIAVQ